jgi:hypothetical protein
MRITNIQKKELSEIFKSHGLNVLDFETSGQYKEFKVKFKHDYFSFSINGEKREVYNLIIFPISNTKGMTRTLSWAETKKEFDTWTKDIATDLTTPTGWETFESQNYLNTDFEELDKEFTESEKVQTRESVRELIEKIKTLDLPAAHLGTIELKLKELSDKVDDLKKFDWKSLFIGTIASLIMTLSIPPEATGFLWEYIKSAFSGLRLKA